MNRTKPTVQARAEHALSYITMAMGGRLGRKIELEKPDN
jgi:hypothetical protein